MNNNIYLKSLEIGYNNIDGVSFNKLVEKVNNPLFKNNEKLLFHFNIWFYTNFYNENAYSDVLLHNTFANHSGKIIFSDKERITKYNNELSFIKGDSISKYIEYVELKEARKSSKNAFRISILSLAIACASVVIPIIIANNQKPLVNKPQTEKRNSTTNSKNKDSIKTEFTIDSVINKKTN
jgi:hypothetical protein